MAKKQIILDDEARKRIAEIEKLTKEERFVLDAYIVSKESLTDKLVLAYSLSRKREPTKNYASLEQQMYRWLKRPSVQYYIEDREIELFGAGKVKRNGDNESGNVLRSKDETLEELNFLASQTTDAKLKAELLMKIADLQNWKKEQQVEESEQIKYYLPQKCSHCELYKSAKMTKVPSK